MNHQVGKCLERFDKAFDWEWYQSEVDSKEVAGCEGEKHIAE